MIIDNLHRERYFVLDGIDIHKGWEAGWSVFNKNGSPYVYYDVFKKQYSESHHERIYLDVGLWPDTKDYEQNSPGIIEKVHDLSLRGYRSEIEQSFWINVLRVPICVSYLAACAKVRPRTILELGTGGNSAHSTGMFIYWLWTEAYSTVEVLRKLVSVDRHPLSHVWPRYRNYPFWSFIQGDSISVMEKLINNEIYDLIIIDRNKPKDKTPKPEPRTAGKTGSIITDVTQNNPNQKPGPKGKKTKAELREIALKAVKTRRENNPGWGLKKKSKKKTLKK